MRILVAITAAGLPARKTKVERMGTREVGLAIELSSLSALHATFRRRSGVAFTFKITN